MGRRKTKTMPRRICDNQETKNKKYGILYIPSGTFVKEEYHFRLRKKPIQELIEQEDVMFWLENNSAVVLTRSKEDCLFLLSSTYFLTHILQEAENISWEEAQDLAKHNKLDYTPLFDIVEITNAIHSD